MIKAFQSLTSISARTCNQSLSRSRLRLRPSSLTSHDLRILPCPDLTALQPCTTKNPHTTRQSGMKCGNISSKSGIPGGWPEFRENRHVIRDLGGWSQFRDNPGKPGILGRYAISCIDYSMEPLSGRHRSTAVLQEIPTLPR